jgi:uncharacterized protein (TIGR02646 family)
MLQVKKTEPTFFIDKKREVKFQKQSSAWEEIQDIRSELREYILDSEQKSMCAYCEKRVTSDKEDSNIDHFRVRNLFPKLTLEYSNLFVSCNNKNHCSSIKDNLGLKKEEFEKLITPLENIEDNFRYTEVGEIEGLNEKAKFTIECFGLNHISLVEERKTILMNIENYKDFEIDVLIECLSGHENLIKEKIND